MANKKKFDWEGFFTKLWLGRKTMLWWIVGCAAFGVFVAFTKPYEYTVQSSLAPEQTGLSNLSSLASMIGMNVGGLESTDAIDPSMFPDIASSLPFLIQVTETPVHSAKDTTMIPYLAWYKKQPTPLYVYVVKLPGIIMQKIRGYKPLPAAVSADSAKTPPYILLSEKDMARLGQIGKNISVTQNIKTMTITVSVTETDPMVATMLNAAILDILQQSIIRYKTSKAAADLRGYKSLSDSLYAEYRAKQADYADFVGKNRSISNELISAEKERLQSEMELTLRSLQQITQQRYLAEATLLEQKPAFAVLNPPAYPTEPDSSRKKIVLVWAFLGFVISALWLAYCKDYYKKSILFFQKFTVERL